MVVGLWRNPLLRPMQRSRKPYGLCESWIRRSDLSGITRVRPKPYAWFLQLGSRNAGGITHYEGRWPMQVPLRSVVVKAGVVRDV